MKIQTATITRLRDTLLQSGRREAVVVTSAYETLAREGLLDDDETSAVEQVSPLAETMFLMMAADGSLAEQERDALRGAVIGLSSDKIHPGTINVMLESFQVLLDKEGRDERLKKIAVQIKDDPNQSEGAFALAAAIALADDNVEEGETAVMKQLAEWFEISEERQHAILQDLDHDTDDEAETAAKAAKPKPPPPRKSAPKQDAEPPKPDKPEAKAAASAKEPKIEEAPAKQPEAAAEPAVSKRVPPPKPKAKAAPPPKPTSKREVEPADTGAATEEVADEPAADADSFESPWDKD